VRVGRKHREAVARRHEEVLAEDHVAVAVAVRCGAEVHARGAPGQRHQLVRVHQVRVRMAAAEVGQRLAVQHRAGLRAQAVLEDLHRIRPGHRVHGIEAHAEPPALNRL
jgi:hypothetical protein